MAISRGNTLLMKKQWAEDGSTVIPNPPVAGTTYRDESVDEANIAEGQQYDGVADSARWNQLLYIMTGILKDTLAHGVLPWINTQDYAEGAVVIGSNGTLYIAKIANGPTTTNVKDPTTDATADTWKTVLAISSVGEGLQIESNKLKLSPYKGATASEAGELGGVPPAAKEDKDKFLKGDGTWAGVVRSVNGNAPDNAGNVVVNSIPSGTKMLFNQAAAPTGWTKQTSVSDAALRVVSGDGGGTGGSIEFSKLFTAGKKVSLSGNVGSTTITTSTMPSHNHAIYGGGPGGSESSIAYYETSRKNENTIRLYPNASNTGSSQAHSHTLAGSATISLAVKYTDVIICSKN